MCLLVMNIQKKLWVVILVNIYLFSFLNCNIPNSMSFTLFRITFLNIWSLLCKILNIKSIEVSFKVQLSSVQSLRGVRLFVTPWTAACQASLSITNSWGLLKLMSIELVMPSNHLILCHLLLLPPSIFPSIRVLSNKSVLRIRWPNYWSFSFSISPSNEYSGLISFRMDWLNLLVVQGTLGSSPMPNIQKSNSNSSKSSVLWCSAFFIV